MILCVGPPKAGTLTLHRAFEAAGIESIHGSAGGEYPPAGMLLYRAWVDGHDVLRYIPRSIGAICDPYLTRSPKWGGATYWPTFAPRFLEAYSSVVGRRVLLHTRKTEDWVASVSRWKDLRSRIAKADLPHLPPGKGRTDEELGDWVEGHYRRVRALFSGDTAQFMELAIEDTAAPEKLGAWLNRDFPWWGRVNVNPETK